MNLDENFGVIRGWGGDVLELEDFRRPIARGNDGLHLDFLGSRIGREFQRSQYALISLRGRGFRNFRNPKIVPKLNTPQLILLVTVR